MKMFTLWLVVSGFLALVSGQLQPSAYQIRNIFSSSFALDNTDFIEPEPNSVYFPLERARARNEELDRLDWPVVNSAEWARNLTEQLRLWRGFPELDSLLPDTQTFLALFHSFPAELRTALLEWPGLGAGVLPGLVSLPTSWAALLPSQHLATIPAPSLAALANRVFHPALAYKLLIQLRNDTGAERSAFLSAVRLPAAVYSGTLANTVGYRWSPSPLPAPLLLSLPADRVAGLDKAALQLLGLPALLSSPPNYSPAATARTVWYSAFLQAGWAEMVESTEYRHLLAGASLASLAATLANTDQAGLAQLLATTDMEPPRVQVVWELLNSEQKTALLASQASKLDISQLLAAQRASSNWTVEGEAVATAYLSGDQPAVPAWVNLLHCGLARMKDQHFTSWTGRELARLGRLVILLSPTELASFPSNIFTEEVLKQILSPALSLPQLTAVYRQVSAADAVPDLPASLLNVLPSSALLSPDPPFTWSEDRAKLLQAAATASPAQQEAVRQLAAPGRWAPANLSLALSNGPGPVLDVVVPSELQARLPQLLAAIDYAGPERFYNVATRLQSLPRSFLMGWLESALVSQPTTGYIKTEFLLDRVTPTTRPDPLVVNPEPSHALSAVFDRFTSVNASSLPSLAVAGLACHHIARVPPSQMMEVIAHYRLLRSYRPGPDSLPSSVRKCWARKLRELLVLKSQLYNVTVSTEPELLSLLSTADIQTVGAEVLLTWGGPALASITNIEVAHEVLMAVGRLEPHHFLSNGVTYSCMQTMGRSLADFMVKHEKGEVDLTALTHAHNLLPFASDGELRILNATANDLKTFLQTVLKPDEKILCLKTREREFFRNIILKAYGPPADWDALDLTELGDLLVVLHRTDLSEIAPTAARLAAPGLALNTRYTARLPGIRHFNTPTLQYEACEAWLGGSRGMQSQESLLFSQHWSNYANFIIIGNHLQVEVLKNGMTIPKPRSRLRRKRQVELGGDIDIKATYIRVMDDMKSKFDRGNLTDIQKQEATRIISETQRLLGDSSLAVLGLERGNLSQSEVLAVLAAYKEAGNMTESQNTDIRQLAVDTQVRMIQHLTGLLGLAATDLNLTELQFEALKIRTTFGRDVSTEGSAIISSSSTTTANPSVVDLLSSPSTLSTNKASSSTATTTTSTTSSTTTLSTTIRSTSTTTESTSTTSTTSNTTISTTVSSTSSTTTAASPVSSTSSATTAAPLSTSPDSMALSNVLNETAQADVTFSLYEPSTTAFTRLPTISRLHLDCDCLIAAGPAATAVSPGLLAAMDQEEVENCLAVLGRLPWSVAALAPAWRAVRDKLPSAQQSHLRPVKRDRMLELGALLPAVAVEDPDLLDLTRENIDGISLLGSSLPAAYASHQSVKQLMQRYLTDNGVTGKMRLTLLEVKSLGSLLCGLEPEQWASLLPAHLHHSAPRPDLFSELDCVLGVVPSQQLAGLAVAWLGEPHLWSTADLLALGRMAATLSPAQLTSLQPTATEGLTGLAVKYLTPDQVAALSPLHIASLAPHSVSFLSRAQLATVSTQPNKVRVIRSVSGEDEVLQDSLKTMEAAGVIPVVEDPSIKTGSGTPDDEVPSSGSGRVTNLVLASFVFTIAILL